MTDLRVPSTSPRGLVSANPIRTCRVTIDHPARHPARELTFSLKSLSEALPSW